MTPSWSHRHRRVAVVGLGRMGMPITGRLVAGGHQVAGFDSRAELQDSALSAGATWASSAQSACDQVDVVLTCLPGSPELAGLMLGDGGGDLGLISTLAPGQVWIDLTSAAPDLAERLATAAKDAGVAYLDAGMGGNPGAATRGELSLFVGGDSDVVEQVRPLLECIARPSAIWHMGGAGTGYLGKLLINLLWFSQAVSVGETLLLAQRSGITPDLMGQVLSHSAAGSDFISSYLPRLLCGDYLTSFGVDRCVEELVSLQRLAELSGLPFTVSTAVTRLHQDALDRFGPIDGELTAVALLEHRADRLLRANPTNPTNPTSPTLSV